MMFAPSEDQQPLTYLRGYPLYATHVLVLFFTATMLVCTIIGGYWGAHGVQRLSAETARRTVLVFAWTMSVWLLIRSW